MANSVVPNVAMLIAGGGEVDTRRRPGDVRGIMVHNIVIPETRMRPVDHQKVQQIKESIRELGLLQPIGVKYQKAGQPFVLIYGAHRLVAKQQLIDDDPTQDTIAACVYPADMPDWACELNEVAENLCRKELTPKERDAHTAIYAGLLKQHGSVVDGKTVAGARSGAARKGTNDPSESGRSLTVTRKVAADLGITDDAVRNRVRNANKLASRNGVAVDKPTPEKMSGQQLVTVGRAALKAAEDDKIEAARQGKSPRHMRPHEPSKLTVATVRLDVTDPAPFISWCRARIAGKHKPMSLDILKSYGKALTDLIKEIEDGP